MFSKDPFLTSAGGGGGASAAATGMGALFGGGGGSAGVSGKNSKRGKAMNSNAVGMAVMIMIPWLLYVFAACMYAFLYHHYEFFVWILSLCCIIFCGIAFFVDPSRGNVVGGKDKMMTDSSGVTQNYHAGWYTKLSLSAFFAFFVGTFCGQHNYYSHMANYWAYEENRAYTNVLPTEPAAAHADAGKITFAVTARVDTTKAVGFKSASIYCVAPILDATQSKRVEFWAVGMDCCGQRATFDCDDAWNPKARSGVVVFDHGSQTSSKVGGIGDGGAESTSNTSWFLPGTYGFQASSPALMYLRAVNVAVAQNDLVTSSKPLLVRWVEKPQDVQDDFWRSGVGYLIASCCIYLLVSIIIGVPLQISSRRNKPSPPPPPPPSHSFGTSMLPSGLLSTSKGGSGGSSDYGATAQQQGGGKEEQTSFRTRFFSRSTRRKTDPSQANPMDTVLP